MTIKDIASKCGVSVSTVSRVLNNHPYVKEDIRERVLKAIESEHFVPHSGAVDLVKSQTDTIGVLVRGIGNQFFQEIIDMLETAIVDSGYAFVVRQIPEEGDEIISASAFAKDKKLKGVILLGGRYNWTQEEAKALTIPFVCCTFNNMFGDITSSRFSSVSIDDKEDAYRATNILIENGHKRIAILLPSTNDHSVSQLRYEGYCSALQDAGITWDEKLVKETGSFEMGQAYESTIELIEDGEEFTAMFAISDFMAMAATKALSDMEKKVPDDISVIAIDGVELSRYMIPTLTTLVQPRAYMTKNAVEILIRMIEGKSKSAQMLLNTDLRKGGSVKRLCD